jgi:phage terminase large subunit
MHFLPPEQVYEIELMKTNDPLKWQVYGLGKRASLQKGQIFGEKRDKDGNILQKAWTEITDTEYNAINEQEIFALDWGFYPDPNAVLGVKACGDKRWIKKYVYEQNQSDEALAVMLSARGLNEDSIIIADHSKKSIYKLRELGFPLVYPAVKPKHSVLEGIKIINTLDTHYVFDPDLDFEYLNYVYLLGPDEEPTGVPQDKHNHLMDDYRYVELYRPHL